MATQKKEEKRKELRRHGKVYYQDEDGVYRTADGCETLSAAMVQLLMMDSSSAPAVSVDVPTVDCSPSIDVGGCPPGE